MPRAATKYIVVHVTATPPTADIGVKEVRVMHKARGFNDIGYHFVIRRSGKVETGRPEGDIGAHVAGFNSISIGVSLVGGVDARGQPQHNATPEQMAALEALLLELTARHPQAGVCGHRDLSPDRDGDGVIEPGEYIKACPCFDVIPWARERGIRTAKIKGPWDAVAMPSWPSNPVKPPKAPDLRPAQIQSMLVKAGYAIGPVDGIIGPKTQKAIKAFQASVGLPATGEPDAKTTNALRARFGV